MTDISYITKQKFSEIINIDYKDINTKRFNQKIYHKLLEKVGDRCYNNGYTLRNSVEMINKSLCKLESLDSNNLLTCKINFSVDMIRPGTDDIIECYIDNINKMGVIAYIKLKDLVKDYKGENVLKDSPLIIIVPLQVIDDIDELNIGQKIKVKVNASRLKFNAKQIQVVGEIVD